MRGSGFVLPLIIDVTEPGLKRHQRCGLESAVSDAEMRAPCC